jgi:hypothetical protein
MYPAKQKQLRKVLEDKSSAPSWLSRRNFRFCAVWPLATPTQTSLPISCTHRPRGHRKERGSWTVNRQGELAKRAQLQVARDGQKWPCTIILGVGSNGGENSGKAFSFVDSSEPSGIKLIRGQHHRGLTPKVATWDGTDRPATDCKRALYRCSVSSEPVRA